MLLKKPLAGFYVTNITDSWVPFTAVIEMSALVDRGAVRRPHAGLSAEVRRERRPVFAVPDQDVEKPFLAALSRMYPSLAPEDVLAFKVSRERYVYALPTLNYSERCPAKRTSLPGVHIVNSAHIVNGTLNVNETVRLAEEALPDLLAADRGPGLHRGTTRTPDMTKPVAALSLDLDNQWSYMKTHGDRAGSRFRPTSTSWCLGSSTSWADGAGRSPCSSSDRTLLSSRTARRSERWPPPGTRSEITPSATSPGSTSTRRRRSTGRSLGRRRRSRRRRVRGLEGSGAPATAFRSPR